MNSSTRRFPRPFRASDPRAILPRSASLALWLPRATGGYCSPELAVASVQHEDEPHVVSVRTDHAVELTPLIDYVRSLSGTVLAVGSAFPVPGDVASAPFLAVHEGVESEELVLVRTRSAQGQQRNIALVPQVTQFGSHVEEGFLVRWHHHEISPWEYQIFANAGSIAEATRDLRTQLLILTEGIAELGASKSPTQHSDLVDLLRDPADISQFVPADIPPRTLSLLELAARLRAIVDIARLDDGGSLSGAIANTRSTLLRQVDAVARRAMEAATLQSPLSL